MSFGVYVHIPFCIQRCKYCDFATNEIDGEKSRILPPEKYVEFLEEEIRQRADFYPQGNLDTLYFGGGTPSLLEPKLLEKVITALSREGFSTTSSTEITLEINPGTMNPQKLEDYLAIGFNRFSVGCQTFDEALLKRLGREHAAHDTRQTLRLLQERNLNFSVDLLFALPGQSLELLQKDVLEILSFNPPHISPYCLTLPDAHSLNVQRPSDDDQVAMFELIHKNLISAQYQRYEISNYCLAGQESRHNNLYWMDEAYWGIGLSAHSYMPSPDWGTRFWNPRAIEAYKKMIEGSKGQSFKRPQEGLSTELFETLKLNESLTDFFHTSLRRADGVDLGKVQAKFGSTAAPQYIDAITRLVARGLIMPKNESCYSLTDEGIVLSNEVFRELTFSEPL